MSGYEPVRRPRLDGSVHAPRLGLHVHVGLRDGKLARVGISHDAHEGPVAPEAAPILERLARHCERGDDAFLDVPLSLDEATPFEREVLTTLVREVPPGEVVTYGELARMVGRGPGAARAIGGAMARNPLPIVVPCHRVVPAGRRVGNYSGEGGWETKMRLLAIEGARGVWAQAQL
ncbi:MAG TPA: methylated-DNA--[protein]-cysteine S-methyltransferase [Candidatus Thermoplasmatota archaeon]|nr:methylated-DNA--[protein]-cysteine S-methyltransferase [Candidatus Thermoplasmatota archaeon]